MIAQFDFLKPQYVKHFGVFFVFIFMPHACFYLFTNDQRLNDNRALKFAEDNFDFVVPVFLFDSTLLVPNKFGMNRMGKHRLRFLFESLASLKLSLQEIGSDLWCIHTSNPLQSLVELKEKWDIQHLCVQANNGSYEKKFLTELETAKFKVFEIENDFLFEKLPFELPDLPFIFTDFRKKVEANTVVASTIAKVNKLVWPSNIALPGEIEMPVEAVNYILDKRSAFPFAGGESAALHRLNDYMYVKHLVKSYKQTRNQLIGSAYSTKFSPWLALGNVSARQIVAEINAYERSYGSNESTYWVYFELLWREFFKLTARKYGDRLFYMAGFRGMQNAFTPQKQVFENWCSGKTGNSFVDANMKELLLTGFMSNRGRQNVASFLVHDLGVNWQLGAAWFEMQLLDYDVSSNWCNWQYIAGIGNDPRFRKFNISLQQERYDPSLSYTRLWNI